MDDARGGSRKPAVLWIAAWAALLAVAGCEPEPGEWTAPALDEPTYERLLVEVMVTHQMYDTMADSARVDSARRTLMRRNGTTWEAFLETHARYEQDLESQIERISRLQSLVQREMQTITAYQRGDPDVMEEVRRLLKAEQGDGAAEHGPDQEGSPDSVEAPETPDSPGSPGSPDSPEPAEAEATEAEASEKAPVDVS